MLVRNERLVSLAASRLVNDVEVVLAVAGGETTALISPWVSTKSQPSL